MFDSGLISALILLVLLLLLLLVLLFLKLLLLLLLLMLPPLPLSEFTEELPLELLFQPKLAASDSLLLPPRELCATAPPSVLVLFTWGSSFVVTHEDSRFTVDIGEAETVPVCVSLGIGNSCEPPKEESLVDKVAATVDANGC